MIQRVAATLLWRRYVGSFDKMTKETLEYMQRQVSNLELVDVESVPYPYHHRWLWETGKALQIPDTGLVAVAALPAAGGAFAAAAALLTRHEHDPLRCAPTATSSRCLPSTLHRTRRCCSWTTRRCPY